MTFLILGDGLLGSELQKQTGFDFISRKNNGFDIQTSSLSILDDYDTIINCIACTDTYSTEKNNEHFSINADKVIDLVEYCNRMGKKLVHISTDYMYTHSISRAKETDPIRPIKTAYGYSKLIGDMYVINYCNNYLLIRTSFKRRPFQFNMAVAQRGNFDYVDIITNIIVNLILNDACGIYNVGTSEKTMLELAHITNENVAQGTNNNEKMPTDITMDIAKLQIFLENCN